MIDAGHQVSVIAAAPILVIRVAELLAVTRRAARVASQNRVAARVEDRCRIEVGAGGEVLREDAGRTAVNDQQQRDTRARAIIDRIVQYAFDLSPILALPSNH